MLSIMVCISTKQVLTFNKTNADKNSAHPIDIFSLAVTPTQILSASGAASLKVHSTTEPDFPAAQTVEGAHKIGCHHVVTSGTGVRAASVGFGGEVKIWAYRDSVWTEDGTLVGMRHLCSLISSIALFTSYFT